MAEDFLKLNMEEYLPLREVVFRTLRQAILKGELKPGERLLELHLADRLGVSRTPIREAIRMLELEGLVLMIPRKGAEVARISEKGLQDVLEVRRALEELSVELACARIREDGLRQLKAILKEEQNAMAQENVKAFIQGDIDFHDAIYKAADNQRLEQLINNLQEQIYRYRLEYIKDLKQWPVILEEHAKVIETLEAQDVAAAREAICTHISNQEMNVRERLLHEN
ncbi:MAG: GntR family transcriptional regulator [Lachnospiraceae bacterium]|nr:GntR family transcriptional regulator [Cuneatibacter sp.]MDD6455138.1 GntR family transcriptional regulator [Lachnospiraceae bacterium]